MKKLTALMLGVALFITVLVPRAEARDGGAFVLGAVTGALVAGAVTASYYSSYYYPQPVVVQQQQPVYQSYPVYQPVYIAPSYTPGPYYGFSWGWYVR